MLPEPAFRRAAAGLLERPRSLQMSRVCKSVSGTKRSRLLPREMLAFLPVRSGRVSKKDGWLRTRLDGLRRSLAGYTVAESCGESIEGGKVVGRPVHRADRHHGGSVHGIGRLRSQALPAGHRGLRRSRHHARRGRSARPRRARCHRGRPSRHRIRHRGRPLRVVLGARGRSHEHRGRAHRTDRRGGKEAPHRALAQRSGRHRPSPLRARRDGCGRRRASPAPGGAARPRRARSGDGDARLHPPPVGAADHLRPPRARVARDARAGTPRGSPMRGAGSTDSPSGRRLSRARAFPSTPGSRPGCSTSTAFARTRSTR